MEDDDAIAIVGVGCRFPGADNIDDFWRVLSNGENHVIEVPPSRWNLDAFYDADPQTPGKTYVRRAGFILGHDEWDNHFFGINDDEAERMDPQQRFVLDCVHMAAEDGGFTRKQLSSSRTGVYIGVTNDDYKGTWGDDLKVMDNYSLTGSSSSIIAARVSYVYNFLGPSMSIDTACSSSLVAIHTASHALRAGDCSMAVCGGVNSILYPDVFVPLSRTRMLSPTGQCQAFSDKADGYARGEGCGIVFLKKWKQAKLDGNKVWALIYTGCNQDGHAAVPITAPSGKQQEELMKHVYEKGLVHPCEIQYIEAHGTGTPVGDPIEVNALGHFFNIEKTNRKNKIFIGSVKTNIGHQESAAGVAGLIKTLLMMKHGKIVPSLYFDNPNPKIKFEEYGFVVPTENFTWQSTSEGYRLACVNSFGFGGTNCHAIIKQILPEKQNTRDNIESGRKLITVSAIDQSALTSTITNMVKDVEMTNYRISELAYTSTCRRDHYNFRAAFVVQDKYELITKCKQRLQEIAFTNTKSRSAHNVIFVFCGVGTAWKNMCQKMISEEPVFLQAIKQIDRYFEPLSNFSIVETLKSGIDTLDPFICHLAIFACQIGLTAVWKHWGVTPDIIVGQSVGEVAAGCIAGQFSLEDAVKIIYYRSDILAKATGGKMVVVGNHQIEDIETLCKRYKGKANIAVYSSPMSCAVSGDADAIDSIKTELQKQDLEGCLFIRDLDVKCAYHSHHTDEASKMIGRKLVGIKSTKHSVKIISSVTGKLADGGEFSTPQYWVDNVRKTVLFTQALQAAHTNRMENIFVEIGPKQVLKPHIKAIFPAKDVCVIPSMNLNTARSTMLESLAILYQLGINPFWENVVDYQTVISHIPRYSFQRQKQLFQTEPTVLKNQGLFYAKSSHPFIERMPGTEPMFRINLSPDTTPFVYEHFVSGNILLPGAFYAEVALEIGRQILKKQVQSLVISTKFIHPFSLIQGIPSVAHAKVEEKSNENIKFTIFGGKDIKAEGTLREKTTLDSKSHVDITMIFQRCKTKLKSDHVYDNLERLGFSYGDGIRVLGTARTNEEESLVEIKLTDMILKNMEETHIHPAILDALFQATAAQGTSELVRSLLPLRVAHLSWQRPPVKRMYGYVVLISKSEKYVIYNAMLLTTDGSIVVEVKGFTLCFIDAIDDEKNNNCRQRICWKQLNSTVMEAKNNSATERSHKTYVISFTDDLMQFVKKMLPKDDLVSFMCQHKDEDFIISIKTFFDKFSDDERLLRILFVIGQNSDTDLTGEMLLQMSISTTKHLLQLITFLEKRSSKVPIYVITEATQNTSTDLPLTHANVFGAELWGLVRSILCESFRKIYLVDIASLSENNMEALRQILDCSPDFPEFAVAKGCLLTNQFEPCDDISETPRFITSTMDHKCRVDYRSTHHARIEDPFFVLNEKRLILENDNIVIRTEYACLHDPDLFPISFQNSFTMKNLWPENNESGYDVLSLEVKGFGYNTLTNTEEHNILHRKTTKTVATSYVACFPVNISNYVTVPLVCTCKLEDIPCYKPGLLQILVILWNISLKTNPFHDACVLVESEYQTVGTIMKLMLGTKNGRQVVLETPLNIQNSNDKTRVLVCLCPLSPSQWKSFLSKFPNVAIIISIRPILSLEVTRVLKILFPSIKVISIETDEIFDKSNLVEVFPKTKAWICSNNDSLAKAMVHDVYNVESPDVKKNILSLGCKTLQLSNDRNSINVSYRCRLPETNLFLREACYIVVGGLTGLGWEIVKLLAKRKAGYIISMSRRYPNKETLECIEEMNKSTGSVIVTLSVNICDMSSLRNAFAEISTKFPNIPIKGIFQGAAVLQDAMFQNISENHLRQVFSPKIQGTWNLHLISKSMSLDYFILHSSITSVIGNFGQSNYAAANSFMDTLASYRRSIGLCGQSINWGPLAVGMVANKTGLGKELKRRGYELLNPDDIEKCLIEAILMNNPQVVFCSMDWDIFGKELLVPEMAFSFARFTSVVNQKKLEMASLNTDTYIAEARDEWNDLFTVDAETKQPRVLDLLRKVASRVFVLDTPTINGDSTLFSLGIDSMLAMTFGNRIFEITSIKIPILTLMTDEATISTIVAYLLPNIQPTASIEQSSKDDASFTDAMTPYENGIYNLYVRDNSDPSLITFTDIEVSGILTDPEFWKNKLKKISLKHPILRTRFIPDSKSSRQYNIRKAIISHNQAEVDMRFVKITEITHTETLPENLNQYIFDPAKHFPIRILFAKEDHYCLIRLVFSMLSFDLTAVSILVRELQSSQTEDKQEQSKNDMNSLLVERKLRKDRQILASYWTQEFPLNFECTSLSSSINIKLDYKTFAFKRRSLPRDLCLNIQQYMAKKRLTLFHLIATMYQILLHLLSRKKAVTIVTLGDMRLHFHEFEDKICRFTNPIPLFMNFNDVEISLDACVLNNTAKIKRNIAHGELPFSELLQLVHIADPSVVYRHQLTMEDTTPLQQNNFSFKIKRTVTGNYNNETALYVWFDRDLQYINLELGFNTQVMNEKCAEFSLHALQLLMERLTKDPIVSLTTVLAELRTLNQLINNEEHTVLPDTLVPSNRPLQERTEGVHLHEVITPSSHNCTSKKENDRTISFFGDFYSKQTTKGWEHKVYLTVTESNISSEMGKCLSWGSNPQSITKHISVKSISSVDLKAVNGKPALIVKTSRRSYVFKSSKISVVDKWISFFKRELEQCENDNAI